VTRVVQAEEIFAVPVSQAFDAYWTLSNWPKALDSILEVNVEYDDGTHQCFDMTVRGPQQTIETVRGARFNHDGRRLELCQFQAPPGFRSMTGAWNFEPIGDAMTRVRAERAFVLEDPAREDMVAAMMAGLLSKNLQAFRALAEAGRS
jgi:ribosome-associated toxin RatA of RatAB toxin-antitoxin module